MRRAQKKVKKSIPSGCKGDTRQVFNTMYYHQYFAAPVAGTITLTIWVNILRLCTAPQPVVVPQQGEGPPLPPKDALVISPHPLRSVLCKPKHLKPSVSFSEGDHFPFSKWSSRSQPSALWRAPTLLFRHGETTAPRSITLGFTPMVETLALHPLPWTCT